MIIAERSDFRKYASVNPHFSKVCDFLENTDFTTVEDGRVDIDGDAVFANFMTYEADGVPGQQFETHKKYLDIHLVVSNTEKMAVSAAVDATLKVDFDVQQDIGFYDSEIYQMVTLTESNLLVTFEEDFHQPKIRVNDEPVRKLVIKVLNAEV
ncbi:YhcH/YjgK/YiaL family protein [Streptococcus danieliae]|uniref:YhcH/YjgK/YiaL family protein n=1 Tax=Streptococcus danieliae TaxID=747656 RepID=A0A7Z0LE64_9STRE|nr:YhcH/YjgK/YiaL family protein [Streptococcus danieliae]MBF0717611.1 YhcH/YjgK/YiaL family protein [Streptococcus danieliae]NYS49541.1 YhcH/YjgK/YiaL family protein [Streptococcus danieliae]